MPTPIIDTDQVIKLLTIVMVIITIRVTLLMTMIFT